MKDSIIAYIKKKYRVQPETPWRKNPENIVFRHADNNKWFALFMDVHRDKLGMSGTDYVTVINLKVNDMFFRDILIQEEGIMPAYHMNKQHWITVLLDGTVQPERVYDLLDMSYMATASAKRKEKIQPSKE
ncbi:MAG: MmcQ/YjbR family DNA-binding protein [Bacteroidales bacterium]|nr:MmcQ/YjbR family DNA-binding protein [Bacteroidales bacterium]MCM1416583.1 MmcQ/YjbR family DNA-binding protein [bacterium]MCM1422851.1 MmcQ/YjbR family DNA-binding protein [bacterium]